VAPRAAKWAVKLISILKNVILCRQKCFKTCIQIMVNSISNCNLLKFIISTKAGYFYSSRASKILGFPLFGMFYFWTSAIVVC
jgi:hypothetical protein